MMLPQWLMGWCNKTPAPFLIKSNIGVCLHGLSNDGDLTFAAPMMLNLGIQGFRRDHVQSQNDSFPDLVASQVATAALAGQTIKWLPVLSLPATLGDIPAWVTWASSKITKYGFTEVEIGNEPDLIPMTASLYVSICQALRVACPNVRIIGGGPSNIALSSPMSFLSDCVALGLLSYVDEVSAHVYLQPGSYPVSKGIVPSLIPLVKNLRSVVDGWPIRLTEVGSWGVSDSATVASYVNAMVKTVPDVKCYLFALSNWPQPDGNGNSFDLYSGDPVGGYTITAYGTAVKGW